MIIEVCIGIAMTLILVVGSHEMGHALAARFFRVQIQRVSIGFGKPLWSRRGSSGCEWAIGRWPLGGYVQLLNTRIQPVSSEQWSVCFDKKPAWVRCIILLSGGVANMGLAWLALTLFYGLGYTQYRPVIQTIQPSSLAAQAGFQANDRIVALNHQKTESWQAVCMRLMIALGQRHVLFTVVDANGQTKQRDMDLEKPLVMGKVLWDSLGFEPDIHQKETVLGVSFSQAIQQAAQTMGDLLLFFMVMLKQLALKRIPFLILLGPIGLLDTVMTSWVEGISAFSYFIASFSIAVGFVNLFPIPGLDGGSIVYVCLEKIRGRPISVAWEVLLHRLAAIAFWVFLAQLLVNDLQRYG